MSDEKCKCKKTKCKKESKEFKRQLTAFTGYLAKIRATATALLSSVVCDAATRAAAILASLDNIDVTAALASEDPLTALFAIGFNLSNIRGQANLIAACSDVTVSSAGISMNADTDSAAALLQWFFITQLNINILF